MTKTQQGFSNIRMRRLRQTGYIREMVSEYKLDASDLIWPLFVLEGANQQEDVASMPGVQRTSIDLLIEKAKMARDFGIPAIALFPVIDPQKKCEKGSEALSADNLMCRAIEAVKANVPDIAIVADVALDPYTSHGHDGVIEDGVVLNDETVEILRQQALVQAQAGADIIAPSDMMDGRIAAIRATLDENKQQDTIIMSYAAKYASAFYGPFRDAVGTASALKTDKKTYQMNPANKAESMREVALDVAEGADMLMVKPGIPYLDIVAKVKEEFGLPTFAYHVSGEYAMLKAAAQNGWIDYDGCMMETLLGFKRAGCDGILTYAALEAAKILKSA